MAPVPPYEKLLPPMVCTGLKERECLDAMDALRVCPLFENADDESVFQNRNFISPEYSNFRSCIQYETLLKLGKPRQLNQGTKLVSTGDTPNFIYVICRGNLKCLVGGIDLKLVSAGQSIGAVAIYYKRTCMAFGDHKSMLEEPCSQDNR